MKRNQTGYNELSELITLLIADALARKYALHRHAAIQKCCRRLRSQTKSERLYKLYGSLIESDSRRAVSVVEGIHSDLVKEGLL